MATKTLTKDTRCACCGKMMKAGEPFRWHLKSGHPGGSRARGTNDRYVPAHEDFLCDHREEMAAKAAAEQTRQGLLETVTADVIAGKMTVEQAFEAFGLKTTN